MGHSAPIPPNHCILTDSPESNVWMVSLSWCHYTSVPIRRHVLPYVFSAAENREDGRGLAHGTAPTGLFRLMLLLFMMVHKICSIDEAFERRGEGVSLH